MTSRLPFCSGHIPDYPWSYINNAVTRFMFNGRALAAFRGWGVVVREQEQEQEQDTAWSWGYIHSPVGCRSQQMQLQRQPKRHALISCCPCCMHHLPPTPLHAVVLLCAMFLGLQLEPDTENCILMTEHSVSANDKDIASQRNATLPEDLPFKTLIKRRTRSKFHGVAHKGYGWRRVGLALPKWSCYWPESGSGRQTFFGAGSLQQVQQTSQIPGSCGTHAYSIPIAVFHRG